MSKQDYGTPWEFIRACEARFGRLVADLAAHPENAKHETFLRPEQDSLSIEWAKWFPTGTLWLNPPFVDIAPWAAKCADESTRRHGLILMLTPASIGTEWFQAHVHRKALVIGLAPRMIFDGAPINPKTGKPDGYPKDLMLSVFGFGANGFDTWRWKGHTPRRRPQKQPTKRAM